MAENTQEFEDPAKGKLRYLRPFIVLVPTLVVCIFNIVANIPLLQAMLRLLVTILFFFVIGSIAQGIVRYMMLHPGEHSEQEAEEQEEENGEVEDEREADEEDVETQE